MILHDFTWVLIFGLFYIYLSLNSGGACAAIKSILGIGGAFGWLRGKEIYLRISFYIAFIWIIYGFYIVFYMILDGFIHGCCDCRHILKTHFTHMLSHSYSKDHFSSPPAPKFALLWTIIFTVFEKLPDKFDLLPSWFPVVMS